MRERPILFTGPMVRALLNGRKTQTRRVVKHRGATPPAWATHVHEIKGLNVLGEWRPWGAFAWSEEQPAHERPKPLRRWPTDPECPSSWNAIRCPYGVPGDRLWVREAHYLTDNGDFEQVVYAEDQQAVEAHLRKVERLESTHRHIDWSRHRKVRPSIHMPRWASRLTLEITEVRVERLQDISRADAIAEGATPRAVEGAVGGQRWCMDWSRLGSIAFGTTRIRPQDIGLADPQMAFANYINQLHGGPRWNFYYNGDARYPKPIWDVNPWVWAITFRVLP